MSNHFAATGERTCRPHVLDALLVSLALALAIALTADRVQGRTFKSKRHATVDEDR